MHHRDQPWRVPPLRSTIDRPTDEDAQPRDRRSVIPVTCSRRMAVCEPILQVSVPKLVHRSGLAQHLPLPRFL